MISAKNYSREVVRKLAGNLTDARKRAEWELKKAQDAKADSKDIAKLQAAYDAASYEEDKAMGKR